MEPDDPAVEPGGGEAAESRGPARLRHEGNDGAPLAGGASAEGAQRIDAVTELNYVEWDEDGKPAVVLLHGLTDNAHNFEALAQELSPDFHCFAPDLRGHGDTAWSTAGDYRVSTLARDLDAFLQSRGLRRVAMVGTALGAEVALAFAGARPDWISHLVLNDSAPELSDAGLDRIRHHLAESPEEFDSLDAAVDW